MKKLLLFISICLFSKMGFAQQPAPLIWGTSSQQDSIWAIDTTSWLPTINLEPLVTGSVVAGLTGLAYDPTDYKTYAILKMGDNTRQLAEISLQTGACTIKGDLGDNFSSITFDKFGQLYGSTGDGGSASESLFKIDKATATNTLVFAMGNGNDGEVICYNRFDDKIYHWSGNGTLVYESFPRTSTSYTPTNIVTSGTPGGETFGALCLKANDFIISNIASNFRHATASGVYGNVLATNPDDLRGLVMPPRFAVNTSTLCLGSASLNLFSNSLALYDSVYYYWGDGGVTQLLASSSSTAPAQHNYISAGTYTIQVKLFNGAVPKSTITTFTVLVSTKPNVTLTGSPNLCPGGTVTLSGSGGGSSQWYMGGVAVSGATLNSINVTSPGWYNMIKTNLNGCSDSASAGIHVLPASNPTVTVSSATICSGTSFTITPSGASTYTVSGGSAVVNPTTTTTYSVTGTNTAGCISPSAAVMTISVNALPTITLSSSNPTICSGESVTLTATSNSATTYAWNTGVTGNTVAVTLTVSTSFTTAGTDSKGCSNTATINQVVSECTGLTENKNKLSSIRVMPNPGAGKFFMENVTENARVEVYDALGQLILKTTAHTGRNSIDLSAYNAGVYFVRVSQDEKIISQIKLIKE